MAATTKTRSTTSRNGSGPSTVGSTVEKVANKAKRPVLTAGATAAGLAGGLALGTRLGSRRRKILGLPIGRKRPLVQAAEAVTGLARELGKARSQASGVTDDVREIRDQVNKANRQSPVEVLLDGLTHRRGAHKRES
jgi:hypothetical protein